MPSKMFLVVVGAMVLATTSTSAVPWSGNCANTTADKVIEGINLTGQVHVITGGDSGLGYETSLMLSKANATIVILSYDAAGKGKDAAANITKATGNRAEAIQCDLSSLDSVKSAAKQLITMFKYINVLMCDAGMGHEVSSLSPITADGFERIFEVNFIGHFLLVELLLPQLRQVQGRVIDISSDASFEPCSWGNRPSNCTDLDMLHSMATTEPKGNNSYGPASNYGLTKYWQVFHAAEVAKREHSQGPPFGSVVAFSLHPGFVATPMTDHMNPATVKAWCKGEPSPCPIPVNVGASTQVYLASATYSSLFSMNGAFFDQCVPVTSVRDNLVKAKGLTATLAYQSAAYDMVDKWVHTSTN